MALEGQAHMTHGSAVSRGTRNVSRLEQEVPQVHNTVEPGGGCRERGTFLDPRAAWS